MICNSCEHQLPKNANFCPNCGIPLHEAENLYLTVIPVAKALDFELKGKIERAIQELKVVVEKHPTGESFMYLGQLLMFKGELREAIGALKNALVENPLHTRSHFNMGLAYMRLGQIKKSIEYFKKALSINDNFHLARYWLGTVYMHTSDFENARHYFEVLLRKSPDYQIVHYHLGALAIQMADFDLAVLL